MPPNLLQLKAKSPGQFIWSTAKPLLPIFVARETGTMRLEAMYAKAMDAFRGYQGQPSEEDEDYDDGY